MPRATSRLNTLCRLSAQCYKIPGFWDSEIPHTGLLVDGLDAVVCDCAFVGFGADATTDYHPKPGLGSNEVVNIPVIRQTRSWQGYGSWHLQHTLPDPA